LKAVLPICNY